jgi:hypothetical protein
MCIAHKISRVLPAALLAGLALLSTPSVGSAERGGLFDWFGSSWFGPPTRPPPPPAPPPARPPREFATPGPLTATGPTVNDTARYLAGLQPPAGSPIAALTREDGWAGHARFFDRAFGELDRTQLAKIRAWSAATLQPRRPTMFYMFSGPDFLYADAFFPSASTYVLAGLEPVGQIPDLMRMPRGTIGPALGSVANSLHSVLSFSFFITHNMRSELSTGRLGGTVPILYIFLARAGKTVHGASLIALDAEGVEQPDGPALRSAAHGVKIVFSGSEGRDQTLYYFATDLADDSVGRSGFLKFAERLAPADSLLKSASYLMHRPAFSRIRDFLLTHSASILQDDSGIPLAAFDQQKWQLQPFGRYLGPVDVFPQNYQPKLSELFARGNPSPIDFGVGYRWRPHESNLLLAIHRGLNTAGASPTP